MKRDDATKAEVVLEWKAGGSVKGIARERSIPETTVRRWVKDVARVAMDPLVEPKKERPTINDLAGELATESFQAQIAILRLAQDRAWLERQDASALAILFGVNADKLYRLLPAFVPPSPDQQR